MSFTSLKLPPKALLVLDNAPTHPQEIDCEGNDIKLLFLPPNVTSVTQPMDQGVIECLKRRYRRKLLSEILDKMDRDDNIDLIQALKSINIKDVIYMVAQAYDEIPASTFTKSWRKAWPNVEEIVGNNGEENNPKPMEPNNLSFLKDLSSLPHTEDLQEQDVVAWIAGEDEELHNEMLSDDEILQAVNRQEDNKADEEEDEGEEEEEEKISHSEGRAALELAARYVEQQSEATAVDVMFMKKWRDFAFKKTLTTKIQKKITDFI